MDSHTATYAPSGEGALERTRELDRGSEPIPLTGCGFSENGVPRLLTRLPMLQRSRP
jgi:hypothetical protein